MIKLLATNPQNGRRILGIGLSRGNVNKLLEDQPIHFHAEQMGFVSNINVHEVLIFFGETEEAIYEEFKKKGYLENTKIIREKPERN